MDAMLDWTDARAGAARRWACSTVFFIALVASTLVPLGSEPAVFGLVKLNPEMFWPAILVGDGRRDLGGAITWWMGYGAERAYEHVTHKHPDGRALQLAATASGRRPACSPGCRSSAIRSAPSPAG